MEAETNLALIGDALNKQPNSDQHRIAQEGIAWVALMLRKNKDYGSSAWTPPVLCPNLGGKEAILIRMFDKIARIANLIRPDATCSVKTESLEDTISDLGAYCLLYLTCPEVIEK